MSRPPSDPRAAVSAAAGEPPQTAGTLLREARERAGMSLDDVSAMTRIRSSLLRDLESDRFGSCGGAVYARGHLRACAAAVSTDPAPLLAAYEAQSGAAPTPAVASGTPTPLPVVRSRGSLRMPVSQRPERRGPNWVAAGATAVAAMLVGLSLVGIVSQRDDRDALPPAPPLAQQQPPGEVPGEVPVESAPAPEPGVVAAVPPPAGASLRLRVTGKSSWVVVQGSKGPLFEGALRNGQFKDFRDPKVLRVIVGDAGAVSLVCGGKDIAPAGGPGKVRRFTCSPSGIVTG